MPIKVTCNSCGGVLHAPDDAAGKRGRCPTCGMILSIPVDAPRVTADSTPTPSGTGPSPTYGIAPGTEPLAFPKPPAFDSDVGTKSSTFGSQPATAAMASRLPPDPRRFGDPFAKPGKTAAPAGDASGRWSRVDGGLGLVRWGVVLIVLGVIVPTVLVALEKNDFPLPSRDPGFLGAAGLTQAEEIKVGSALALFVLGGLVVVLGRFRVSAAPRISGAKTIGRAAAVVTLLAWLGFGAVAVMAVKAAAAGDVKHLAPQSNVLESGLSFADRVGRYAEQVFVRADSTTGKMQRFGAVACIVGGLVAELWFLGTLSRLAVWLRSDRAIGRVNRFAILAGTMILLLVFAWMAYSLFGHGWKRDNFDPKWNGLSQSDRIVFRAVATAVIVAIAGFIYTRSLRGLRTAIRETQGL